MDSPTFYDLQRTESAEWSWPAAEHCSSLCYGFHYRSTQEPHRRTQDLIGNQRSLLETSGILQHSPVCKKEVGWCGYTEPIDTSETRKLSSACNSAEQWFSLSIFIGITVVVYLHHMTVGFWICLPSDGGSRLLIACSPCLGPEMSAKSFWKERLPATGGSVCLLRCLEGSSFGYYFEIQNWWVGGEKFVSFSLLHSSLFPNICLHPGFPAFLVLSVPAILLFF